MKITNKKVSTLQSKKQEDLRFYCLMMAIPILQFCIMWVGVNFNSIILSLKEYDIQMNITWTFNNFINVVKDILSDEYLQTSLLNSIQFYIINFLITMPTSLIISFYFYKKFALSRPLKIIFLTYAI